MSSLFIKHVNPTPKRIINSIFFGGGDTEDIQEYYSKYLKDLNYVPPIKTQFCIPSTKAETSNRLYQGIFTDKDYGINTPNLSFTISTTETCDRLYVYTIKFSETYKDYKHGIKEEMKLPLSISIVSFKEDPDEFYLLGNTIFKKYISFHSNQDISDKDYLQYKYLDLINYLNYIYITGGTPASHSSLVFNLNNTEITDSYFYNVSPKVELYFSSLCEIPNNHSNKMLRKLFSVLDVTVIIKIIFAIIHEDSVILYSNNYSMGSSGCPALMKLIFPFFWKHSYIISIPDENGLELPFVKLFGILSNGCNIQEVLRKTSKDVLVVDLDKNEIYNDTLSKKFSPLPQSNLFNNRFFLKYIEKDSQLVGCFPKLENFSKKNPKPFEYQDFTFLEVEKVSIIHKKGKNGYSSHLITEIPRYYFLTSDEVTEFIQVIQGIKNNSLYNNNQCLVDEEENSLNQTYPRSFEYMINEEFMKGLVNKSNQKSHGLSDILKNTDIYNSYLEEAKYQNNTNKVIVNNIYKKLGNSRSIYNSFKVNINMQKFPSDVCTKEIISKLSDDTGKNNLMNGMKKYDEYSKNEKKTDRKKKLNFYGGFFVFASDCYNKMLQDIEDQFYAELYFKPVFLSLFDGVNQLKTNAHSDYIMPNSYDKSQFYLYYGKWGIEAERVGIERMGIDLTNQEVRIRIIQSFVESHRLDKLDFCYYDYYYYLSKLKGEEGEDLRNRDGFANEVEGSEIFIETVKEKQGSY